MPAQSPGRRCPPYFEWERLRNQGERQIFVQSVWAFSVRLEPGGVPKAAAAAGVTVHLCAFCTEIHVPFQNSTKSVLVLFVNLFSFLNSAGQHGVI